MLGWSMMDKHRDSREYGPEMFITTHRCSSHEGCGGQVPHNINIKGALPNPPPPPPRQI